jgi:hypothetical protein
VNSFTFNFAFAVAMASLPPGLEQSIIGPLPQAEQATPAFQGIGYVCTMSST